MQTGGHSARISTDEQAMDIMEEPQAPIEEQIRRIAPQLSHEEAHAIARLFPPERSQIDTASKRRQGGEALPHVQPVSRNNNQFRHLWPRNGRVGRNRDQDVDTVNAFESTPYRVHRRRTKGWRMPPNTVSVTRPGRWGNQFTGPTAVQIYRWWITDCAAGKRLQERAKKELRGKNLACFCGLDQPCHADVLLEIANAR